MKKLIAFLFIAALAVSLIGTAQAVDPDYTARERGRALVDTNATTDVTLKTATAPGQILVGNVAGSNAVWVATKAGTNGWVKVAQTAAD